MFEASDHVANLDAVQLMHKSTTLMNSAIGIKILFNMYHPQGNVEVEVRLDIGTLHNIYASAKY